MEDVERMLTPNECFQYWLVTFMQRERLSCKKLSELSGVGIVTISHIRVNGVSVTLNVGYQLAAALHVTLDDMTSQPFGGEL